jgi:hypothetical protein
MDEIVNLDRIGAVIAAIGLAGILLLIPLYVSQRRDIKRLRAWMERDPEHPQRDFAASEARLDRAERELERLYAERGEPIEETAVYPGPRADATAERPALQRFTVEMEALEPHPRFRRFARRLGQPRWLVAIALVALAAAVAAIPLSRLALSPGGGEGSAGVAALDPATISVSVLNATTSAGLAGQTAAEVEEAGFTLAETAAIGDQRSRSVVMFMPGRRPLARKVGAEIGIRRVERIEPAVRRAAGDADVVVVVGEDRAAG